MEKIPESNKQKRWQWLCQCECGEIVKVASINLIGGSCTHCGCKQLDQVNIGDRIGKLIVIKSMPKQKRINQYFYECLCDCGNKTIVSGHDLKIKHRTSCGCMAYKGALKNGHTGSRLWTIWYSMIGRCYTPNFNGFKNYGARGIIVCQEWQDDFICFKNWAEKSGYQNNLTIERINVNGNYEPDNCTWVTKSEQGRNTRNTIRVEYNGEQYTLRDLLISLNRLNDINLIRARISRSKWNLEKALNTPNRLKNGG